ncbi:hypothetical protein [Paenibacillus larvae]|uniref:Uncharacterized protein n=1 Tax=Paenibacillus larvae TaxID=1464 RepID=A0AAP5JTT8_9BACL|nr:hypothetical protein [Paenibacillus larvae]MDT2251861.1 hypothetical protein [Paenibacillus larvae]MDV3486320.1 hypothetical protein [Paenibacillus larvae]
MADSVNFIKKTRYGGMTDGKKPLNFKKDERKAKAWSKERYSA